MLESPETMPSTMGVPRVLFVIHVDAYFAGFIELVRHLKNSGHIDPHLLFPRWYPNISLHLETCAAEGIPARRLPDSAELSPHPGWKIPFVREVMSLRAQFDRALAVLRDLSPDVMVLGGVIVGHDMAVYIKAARALGIGIAVLPNWMASAREPAELNVRNPVYSLSRFANRAFGAIAPRWVYHHKGVGMLRLPAARAAALELLSMAPRLPWVLHSGDSDVVGVESESAREFGIREGLPRERIEVVGSRTHDTLARISRDASRFRADLLNELGLQPRRWLLLAAIPPDMLGTVGGRPECEFPDYELLVREWVGSLTAVPDANVIVSLHPSADRALTAVVEKLGAKVPTRPVAELIPLCDLYVAAISATIQWAIASGKPTINYDVYQYGYEDYANVSGVLPATTLAGFREVLARLVNDSDYYRQVARLQEEASGSWGRLDGLAGDRIIALLKRVAARHSE